MMSLLCRYAIAILVMQNINVLANIIGQQVFLHWNAHCHGNCPYSMCISILCIGYI